jgi:hypothetical protein
LYLGYCQDIFYCYLILYGVYVFYVYRETEDYFCHG